MQCWKEVDVYAGSAKITAGTWMLFPAFFLDLHDLVVGMVCMSAFWWCCVHAEQLRLASGDARVNLKPQSLVRRFAQDFALEVVDRDHRQTNTRGCHMHGCADTHVDAMCHDSTHHVTGAPCTSREATTSGSAELWSMDASSKNYGMDRHIESCTVTGFSDVRA